MSKIRFFFVFIYMAFAISYSQAQHMEKFMLDDDFDGIPDKLEQPGETYFGLPLYDWGARVGQIDIFIEIDYMNPQGSGEYDTGLVPHREALEWLQLSVRKWSTLAQKAAKKKYEETGVWETNLPHYPIEIHFDVGDLFHPKIGESPENFDLGGGEQVPWAGSVGFVSKNFEEAAADPKRDYYDIYFDEMRKKVFYYMLFGTARLGGGAGEAQYKNVISTVTLNDLAMDEPTLVFRQAAIMMHELGHNLGLQHGGVDEKNFKPNYVSVMNYSRVFINTWLASPPLETTRDENGFYAAFCADGNTVRAISLGASATYITFNTGRSDDNEWFVQEIYEDPIFLTFTGHIINRIDRNCDGVFDRFVAADLNHDGKLGILVNKNDWNSLYLYHHYSHVDEPGVGRAVEEFTMPPF